jgi:hypothetical protein
MNRSGVPINFMTCVPRFNTGEIVTLADQVTGALASIRMDDTSSRRRVFRWLLTTAIVSTPAVANADLSEGCVALGEAMVEHSCFHSTFGPFVSVQGTPGADPMNQTPNVDPVHTEYRVGLPETGQQHVITYSPQRSGSWTVFTGEEIALEVIDVDDDGRKLEPIFEQRSDTGCDALPIARVYRFGADFRYALRLGPTESESVVLVIEYADDFLVSVGRDDDGDGFGRVDDAFISNCTPPAGYAPNTGDCDDSNSDINPQAVELCDDIDQNCNGSVDDVGLQCRTGTGACLVVGELVCTAESAACNARATEPNVEVCNGKDDDCDGVIDQQGDALCTVAEQPRCVRQDFGAFCGCLLDADCGALDSGRVCELDSKSCIDGCSTVAGANGCARNMQCEAEGGTSQGVCVPKPAEDKQTNKRRVSETNNDTGCQCTAAGVTNTNFDAWCGALTVAALAWLTRRNGVESRTHQ